MVLGKNTWAILLPLCSALPGCHDPATTTTKTPTAAEPAVITVEGARVPPAEPPTPANDTALESSPIHVGVLHSLSGTMAPLGTPLRHVAQMTLLQINAEGGVLGRPVEPVVVDPASDWPLFAEKARELLTRHDVVAIFGGETSVSRKAMLPVVEELGGLLFYPSTFEGQEMSCNTFYTGMVPSQQGIPALSYLMSPEGGRYRRFVFLGTDYVLPRTTFRLLAEYAKKQGLTPAQIKVVYTPFGHTDYDGIATEIATFSRGQRTAIVASLWGDSLPALHAELAKQKLRTPVLHLSLEEHQIKSDSLGPYIGSLTARSYLPSRDIPENVHFEQLWRGYLSKYRSELPTDTPIEDIMEATYVGIRLWKLAVERAGSTDFDRVSEALPLVKLEGPMGVELAFDENHFLARPLLIGRLGAQGTVEVRWRSRGPLAAEPYNHYDPDHRPDRLRQQHEYCRSR